MSQTSSNESRVCSIPPPLVAVAGWLMPGAGYWMVGERARGVVVAVVVLVLFIFALLLGGIRVIEVPGYDRQGRPVRLDEKGRKVNPSDNPVDYETGRFVLTNGGLVGEIVTKPWLVPQSLAGPISLAAAALSVKAATLGVAPPHARLAEIGTLYAAVAGMLNLLAIIDSSHRTAARPASRAVGGQDPRPGSPNEPRVADE